ncbi:MAG: hypothetical protein L0Z62_48425 [Gemmataceae bacterium]|nr:hypothetical protein [Gemmataceae bacterium]
MARFPWLVALTLMGGAVLLLTGSVGRPSAPPAAPGSPVSAHESAEAAQLLERAARAHGPGRLGWVEMILWQRHHGEGTTHEVQGRYVAAPDQRLRLELRVCVGQTRGELTLVNDGHALWQALRLDGGEPRLSQVPLPVMSEQRAADTARADLLGEQAFLGVGPLLGVLAQGMQAPRRQPGRWQGKEVIEVTGTWPEDSGRLAQVPESQRPRRPARQCKVYLDAQTLWPYRIEWRGAATESEPAPLLLEMEFRDPILNRPLPAERCAREFTFTPG